MLSLFACIDILFTEYGHIYTSIVFIVHLLFIYYISLYIYGLLNTLIKRYLT